MGEKLGKIDFAENTTSWKVDFSNVGLDSSLHELMEKLNCTMSYGQNMKDVENSIMHYGQLCDHDDGFLCEHRLEWILNYIQEKYK
ncbi:MAG: hypothetical protein ACI9AT_000424 [Ulvibacter sp.]|jgi:hypothetical protein